MMNDETPSAASSASSMKKWGIPHDESPEISLLERLVWVRYKSRWWPALLYHSYSELQQYLYDQLDMVLKAQFAMAIMKQIQEKRQVKVARLLGRNILEVIEVEEDCYCEFYWQLPNVLPKACKRSHYGEDVELFFDFHLALDQVESIIREVSQENFALLPESDNQTWLERAHLAIEGDDTSSIPSKGGSSNSRRRTRSTENKSSVASRGKTTSKAEKSRMEETSVRPSESRRKGGSFESPRRQERAPVQVNPTPSGLSSNKSGTRDIAPSSSETKSRRSTKTKDSQAITEVMDNRTNYQPQQSRNGSSADESREPSTYDFRTSVINGHHSSKQQRAFSPFQVLPGLEGDDIAPGLSSKVHDVRSSFKNVFGMTSENREDASEASDEDSSEEIYRQRHSTDATGTTSARSIPNRGGMPGAETMPAVSNKAMMNAVSAPENDLAVNASRPQATHPLSLWERLTCYTADF